MVDWLAQNKEWVFSGVGVFFIALLLAFLKRLTERARVQQRQNSGSGSVNIQVGGDDLQILTL